MSLRFPRFRCRVRHPARSSRRVALLALALIPCALTAAPSLTAQAAGSGAVRGQALGPEPKPKPIPFTLLVLDNEALSGVALTDRDGRFDFRIVPPGDYRLRLERAGFERDTGVAVHVTAGESVQVTIRDLLRPLVIPPADTATRVCYPGSLLGRAPVLNALWGEAAKAFRARRALDLSYSYKVKLTEHVARYLNYGLGYARRNDVTLLSTPDSARILAARGSFAGYNLDLGRTRLVAVSEMLEVLGDDYLRTNCLRALPERYGDRRVRFEPLNPDRRQTQLIGNIVLDRKLTLRRIEFEYRRGGMAHARGYVEYGDGGLPGGQLRFIHYLRVEMLTAPETTGEVIELSPGEDRDQRAWVDAGYRDFVRDTTMVRP